VTNRQINMRVVGLLAAVCLIGSPYALANSAADADGPVQVLTNLQFSSAVSSADMAALTVPGWTFGFQSGGSLSISSTNPPPVFGDSSFALEANYPASTTGAEYLWADYSVSALNTEDIYVEFGQKCRTQRRDANFSRYSVNERTPRDGRMPRLA